MVEKLEIEKGIWGFFSKRKSAIFGSAKCSFFVKGLRRPMFFGKTSALRKPWVRRLMAVIIATCPRKPCRTVPLNYPNLWRSWGASAEMINAACVGETGITDLYGFSVL